MLPACPLKDITNTDEFVNNILYMFCMQYYKHEHKHKSLQTNLTNVLNFVQHLKYCSTLLNDHQ